MNDVMVRLVFLPQAAATLYMTGPIWYVQIVHYPLMRAIVHRRLVVSNWIWTAIGGVACLILPVAAQRVWRQGISGGIMMTFPGNATIVQWSTSKVVLGYLGGAVKVRTVVDHDMGSKARAMSRLMTREIVQQF